jgi:outer membrane protein OmpA-like peptidoglycan-associated protein
MGFRKSEKMSKQIARPLTMAVLAVTLGLSVSGCQTMADLDPTGLLADDSTPAPDSFPSGSDQQAAADAQTTTPDLSRIPTRPPAPDATAQAATTQQTAAAGQQAQYSADALRAGTEAPAQAPTAADANAARLAAAAAPPSASADAPPTTNDIAAPTASNAAPTAGSSIATASGSVPTTAAMPAANPPPAMGIVASAPPPPPPPQRTVPSSDGSAVAPAVAYAAPPPSAAMAAPPGAEPAVPAVPMTPAARMATANPTDAQLGFRPSSAPPLNPSISQWVSPPILAHYQQTAALAGSAGTSQAAVPAVPMAQGGRKGRRTAMGGPAMSGDVVANLDAVPGTPAGMAAANNGGVPPTAIVYFAGDGTSLTAAGAAQVREAVAAYRAYGGAGTVKVVGHASSRTPNMPVERHLEVIFQKSQARANAVAQALIRAGVPADKVQIEAVGDSQPVYYESMPKGEDGNRRAEIFVQG